MSGGRKDLMGQRFGWLVVIGLAETRSKRAWWRVRCGCGVEKEVSSAPLLSGHTTSCGCRRRLHAAQILHKVRKRQADAMAAKWKDRKGG